MFLKLLLLFVVVPLIELFLLLLISKYLFGPLMTFAIVILTGLCGAWFAQRQGTAAFTRIRQDLAASRMPTDSVTDALMIFVAGAFLMTPGVMTDAIGFGLLIPAGRKFAKYYCYRWIKAHFQVQGNAFRSPESPLGGKRVFDSDPVRSSTSSSESSSAE